jgi:hypothetical protein
MASGRVYSRRFTTANWVIAPGISHPRHKGAPTHAVCCVAPSPAEPGRPTYNSRRFHWAGTASRCQFGDPYSWPTFRRHLGFRQRAHGPDQKGSRQARVASGPLVPATSTPLTEHACRGGRRNSAGVLHQRLSALLGGLSGRSSAGLGLVQASGPADLGEGAYYLLALLSARLRSSVQRHGTHPTRGRSRSAFGLAANLPPY